jgi:hypothetical protein
VVGFGVVEGDERVLEVQVPSAALRTSFDSQAQGFEQPQTASVEEAADEVWDGVELGEDAPACAGRQAFVLAEVGLDVGGSAGAHDVEVVERKAEDVAVEEQEGRESLTSTGSVQGF